MLQLYRGQNDINYVANDSYVGVIAIVIWIMFSCIKLSAILNNARRVNQYINKQNYITGRRKSPNWEVLILSSHNETCRFIKFTSICDICGTNQDWYHEFEQRYSLIDIQVFYVWIFSLISLKSVGDIDQCMKSSEDKNFFFVLLK